MKLRVLPIAITAVALLLTLKAAGLVLTGHYAFSDAATEASRPGIAVAATYRPSAAARASNSWSRQGYDPMVTGSVAAKKEETPETPTTEDAAPSDGGANGANLPGLDQPSGSGLTTDIQGKNPEDLSSSEKALLDRLQSRREELEARERELDLRENLLRAAEKKLEDQISDLRTVEERLVAMDAARKAEDEQKIKDLVVMYENMKPKQAAAIFDRLEMDVLIRVATRMDPKKTGDIVARMEPAAAERLTVALAERDVNKAAPDNLADLPKIEGKKPLQP